MSLANGNSRITFDIKGVSNLENQKKLEELRNSLDNQRKKYEVANKSLYDARMNVLTFRNDDHARLIENERKSSLYNSHRRERAFFNPNVPNTSSTAPTVGKKYKMLGSILDLGNSIYKNTYPRVSDEPLKATTNYYKSAIGTEYKTYYENGFKVQEINPPTKNVIHIPGEYHELYRQYVTLDEVPSNIRAKFGSKNTESILKDQLKVHDTLSEIHNQSLVKKVDKSVNQESTRTDSSRIDNDYYDLGNHLRHCVSHGFPVLIRKSFKESVHNADVNKEYLADQRNTESPYRRKKDWLGSWSEMNLNTIKQVKELENILRSRPTIGFERPRVHVDRTLGTQMVKESKKVTVKRSKSEKFEEFVFEDPPNDDSKQQVTKSDSKMFEKDEDFWKFYNENT